MAATVDIEYESIDESRETKNAIFVIFDDSFDEVTMFIPKSQVSVDEKHKTITVPEWLAYEKGLI